ncbi:peptidase T [Clostridium sp. CX1]|uniref:peptidase T n=1 Tax=Clostridium sp. CX1 TaxID=2978346 RepID=UPI0021C1DC7E|nr:peptidase T [Clostridium sp. CX1]MCT8976697.1 peptidase T [Clostridium sp. CX1]
MSKVIEKFLKYVKIDTVSDEESNTVPSTSKQLVLAEELVKELKEMGMKDVSVDDNGYVMATLPGNVDKNVPVIGFIAHMDTSPEMCGTNVNPKIVENYDGGDIVLNEKENIVLRVEESPELKDYVGKTLITTDGTTLLGADDKAGIAEIMSAIEYLIAHPEIKHGDIRVGFTPDEEIGRGADHFDVKKFNADLAYTVDGGVIGELEYENFNAGSAKVIIKGRNFHPGYSKDKMINSILVANEFINMLPANETPATTEGYEGFYHLLAINGGIEKTELNYIIRDFDAEGFENRKAFIEEAVKKINEKYGFDFVSVEIKEQYRNMKEKVEPVKYIVDIAFEAMESVGIKPLVRPIRGGTDGARLSFMGLPTPNLFTGGHNFHGRFEYIPTFAMEKAVEVIVKIAEIYSTREK